MTLDVLCFPLGTQPQLWYHALFSNGKAPPIMNSTYCGYVVLLGRPNAGKSTLMNACVGQKIAGVSRKPQTTRHSIAGIWTEGSHQVIFLDTPGIHKVGKPNYLNRYMNKTAWSSVKQADLVCYLVDGFQGWQEEDGIFFSQILAQAQSPVKILVTKADRIKHTQLAQEIKTIQEQTSHSDILGMSAKRKEDLLGFKHLCQRGIPQGPWLYSEDDLTDKPERFLVSEMIREQLFRELSQEIPYGTSVTVEPWTQGQSPLVIRGTIAVNSQNHKPMVIGRGGSRLKTIGTKARQSLEQHFGGPVYLELFVKVMENWLDHRPSLELLEGVPGELI